MERMKKDLLYHGESYIFANSSAEYEEFTQWLYDNGAEFRYHFETGEAFDYKGRVIEVYGL